MAISQLLGATTQVLKPAKTSERTEPDRSDEHVQSWDRIGDPDGYTLNAVIEKAKQGNRNWATFCANHAAARAELIGALAYPNPEFEVESGNAKAREEDESGHRPRRNTWSFAFSQPIEMPGKRLARRVEAESGFAVVNGERLEFESLLRADVIEAYYTVHYHGALEKLWENLLEVAEGFEEVANRRVELGDALKIESINARVEVLKAQRELKAARHRRAAACAALNALTGGRLGKKVRLAGGLPLKQPAVSIETAVRTALNSHPRLVRLAAELEQKYASIDRARTEWWPDIKLGVSKAREFDAEGAAVTAGIEIPLWNRNRGEIAKAQAEAHKVHADICLAFEEIRLDVETAWQEYEIARDNIEAFSDGLTDAANEALSLTSLQYREGNVGYLDVLEARRLARETEQGYIEALYDAATARARLDKAVGKTLQ
jgi:cobalt-zinc-cadmium efflux system outer membrane protein